MSNKTYITNSFEETQKLGEDFIGIIPDQGLSLLGLLGKRALVIALYGDLGSGKTTFVQGVAHGLGIKRRIISPTFIIVRNYKLGVRGQGIGIRDFYHVDLYRVESSDDIKGLGIEEIMRDPQNIVAIEWPEKMGGLLSKHRVDIYFEYVSESKRRITIKIKSQRANYSPELKTKEIKTPACNRLAMAGR